MITLSDSALAKIRTTRNPAFYVRITKLTAGNWADGYSKHIYSQFPINHGGGISGCRYIADRTNKDSIRSVSYAVEAGEIGGLAKVGTMELTIHDNDSFVYWLQSQGIYYEGHRVELWFWYEASSGWTSDVLLWGGAVTEVKRDVVKGTAIIRCESRDARYKADAPPNIWPETAQIADLVGKRRSLLLGKHQMAPGVKVLNVTSTGGYWGNAGPTI